MNFYRLVHSIEELVYQFAIWLLLLPKTIIKIIRHPKWMQPYVEEELKKEHEHRFQEYLSPILFWVLISVVPTYYLGFDFFKGLLSEFELMEAENFDNLRAETVMAGIAMFLITGPLTFSIFLEKMLGQPISYTSIRDTFYIQVYIFGPTQLFTGLGQLKMFEIVAFKMNTYMDLTNSDTLWVLYFLFGSIYLVFWTYHEYIVFRRTLKKGRIQSLFLVIMMGVFAYFLLFISLFTLTTIAVMNMEGF